MARVLQFTHNDTEIFQLTGCLANCDKYYYTAGPRAELESHNATTPSFEIKFIVPNGPNEVKEQVKVNK